MIKTARANAAPQSDQWVAIAETARAAIEAAPTGQKVAAVEKLAVAHGISRDHLRRAVAAARLLEKMSSRGVDVPDDLHHMPVGAVDIIARWASYDQVAAFSAARRYRAGEITFRDLMRAEHDARPTGLTKRGPRRLDVVRAWKEGCLSKISKNLGEAGISIFDSEAEEPIVDAWARRKAGTGDTTAIVIVGPHANPARYEQEVADVALRALGLLYLGHRVWLVIPGQKLASLYNAWFQSRRVPQTGVHVIALKNPPKLTELV
jgi:hypothetical protein